MFSLLNSLLTTVCRRVQLWSVLTKVNTVKVPSRAHTHTQTHTHTHTHTHKHARLTRTMFCEQTPLGKVPFKSTGPTVSEHTHTHTHHTHTHTHTHTHCFLTHPPPICVKGVFPMVPDVFRLFDPPTLPHLHVPVENVCSSAELCQADVSPESPTLKLFCLFNPRTIV